MLIFVLGTDIRKKRAWVDERVASRVSAGKAARLFVPEQENFSRDKSLMETRGVAAANLCRTTSFTHFCREYLEAHGQPVRGGADAAGETLLMSLALRGVSDELEIFRRHYRRPATVAQLLSFYKQMKNAGLTPADLEAASLRTGETLGKKAKELSLILSSFEGTLTGRFSDDADDVNAVARLVPGDASFAETELYFDDFRGFTAPQIRLILALLPLCENVYVSLVTDPKSAPDGLHFAHALKNRDRLLRGAAAAGVRVRELVLPAAEDGTGLSVLRRALFSETPREARPAPSDVILYEADNRFEECESIARTVRGMLLGETCRARDVAVLYRDDAYAPLLASAFKKYGVPAYTDVRRSLFSFPLVRGLLAGVEIAAGGFDTETLLSYLKTGIAGVSLEDVSSLENYVYRWQIDGAKWERPFTGAPGGYGGRELTEDDLALLQKINAVRGAAVAPLQKLREALGNGSGKSDAAAVYYFLKEIRAGENFLKLAEELNASGEESEALLYAGVWDRAMAALDTLASSVGNADLSPAAFFELLSLLFTADTLGSVPAGVDKVQCGNVDRVRVTGAKAVFLPGFQEGVYPRHASRGVLTDRELRKLGEADFSLDSLPEDRYEEEKLVAFTALTCAEERLVLGRPLMRVTGETLEPSPFLTEVKALFEALPAVRASALPGGEHAGTLSSALDALSLRFSENSVEAASLRSAVEQNGGKKALSALDSAKAGLPSGIGAEEGTALFGKDLYLSASKAEGYHKCPFAFFCRYGLGAEPVEVSRIDARINGLLVHEALEVILRKHLGENLALLTDETLLREIDEAVERYIETSLSGRENLSSAVLRSLERVKNDVFWILDVIRREFGSCLFTMIGMEVKIGDAVNGVPAYELSLPDGGRVIVTGSVDRVDAMSLDGKTYLRVVDYKTGGKEFRLSDVFDGLNLQMLIYLFALLGAKDRFPNALPAGILYVPAKTGAKTVERRADEEAVIRQRVANGRMNGLILEDAEVIKGMETAARGIYIDALVADDGSLKGKLLSLSGFGALHRRVDRVLRETGEALHEGKTEAVPVDDGGAHSVCDYCPYAAVCLKEADCEKRKTLSLSHADAVRKLGEEDTDLG